MRILPGMAITDRNRRAGASASAGLSGNLLPVATSCRPRDPSAARPRSRAGRSALVSKTRHAAEVRLDCASTREVFWVGMRRSRRDREAGLPYEERLIGLEDQPSDSYRRLQPF